MTAAAVSGEGPMMRPGLLARVQRCHGTIIPTHDRRVEAEDACDDRHHPIDDR